jgi:hypothetical protein
MRCATCDLFSQQFSSTTRHILALRRVLRSLCIQHCARSRTLTFLFRLWMRISAQTTSTASSTAVAPPRVCPKVRYHRDHIEAHPLNCLSVIPVQVSWVEFNVQKAEFVCRGGDNGQQDVTTWLYVVSRLHRRRMC